jgi:1,4-dihydroxy-2-naphthoate octaprenyltransferase
VTESRLNIWLLAARPKTLPAASAPVVIGTALALADHAFNLTSALAALIGALLIQIGTNFANDYFDHKQGIDTAERLGPLRVTQAGLVSPAAMRTATASVFTLALLVGVYLVWRGGWPIVFIGLFSILFGVLYTAGPYPLGYNGWGDIFVLIFFGPVAVGGTYYVQALTIPDYVIVAGLAPGLFSVAILVVNNLRDLDNDRLAGKKTLAVRFGRTFTIAQYILCVTLAVMLPILLVLFFDGPIYSLIAVATALPAPVVVRQVMSRRGRPLNDTLAATGQLLLLYSVLFSLGWLL